MRQGQIIYRLKSLINDWEQETEYLEQMVELCDEHDDPGSDPGLQYEQELEVEKCWKNIADFCKANFK